MDESESSPCTLWERVTMTDAMPARLDASDQVTLLLSMIPFLIESGPVSIDDLAANFHVRPSQAEELVRLLAVSGVPGETASYLPGDLFDISWDLLLDDGIVELTHHVGVSTPPRLSAQEAATLIAGLTYISGIVPDSDRSALESLMTKVSRGANQEVHNVLVAPPAPPADIDLLRQAISGGVSVRFSYRSAGGMTQERLVDPVRLDLVGDSWYLRGYCHSRGELRIFRLDRARDLEETDLPAISAIDPNSISEQLFDASDTDVVVTCRLPARALGLLAGYSPSVVANNPDGHAVVEVRLGAPTGAIKLVTEAPGLIEVLSPSEVRSVVVEWAQSLSQ
jgi:proteasome accessory factor C